MNALASVKLDFPIYYLRGNPAHSDVACINAVTGEIAVLRWTGNQINKHGNIAWNGEKFYSARPRDPNLALEFRNGSRVNRAAHVTFDPTGRLIAAIGPNSLIKLVDAETLQTQAELGTLPGQFSFTAFTPDGLKLLASGAIVQVRPGAFRGRAALFDVASGELLEEIEGFLGMPAMHGSGHLAVGRTGSEGEYETTFLSLGDRLAWLDLRLTGTIGPEITLFSPDGKSLLLAGEGKQFTVQVLDFPSLRPRFHKHFDMPPSPSPFLAKPKQAAFATDSKSLFVPLPSGEVAEIDVEFGHEISRWRPHEARLNLLDLAHAGDFLLTATPDGMLKIWSLPARPGSLPNDSSEAFRSFIEALSPKQVRSITSQTPRIHINTP